MGRRWHRLLLPKHSRMVTGGQGIILGGLRTVTETAVEQLKFFDIHVELIDVQTLLPFDLPHRILESVKKTDRVVFFDEDVPGGATSLMMQKVLQEQKVNYYLDS